MINHSTEDRTLRAICLSFALSGILLYAGPATARAAAADDNYFQKIKSAVMDSLTQKIEIQAGKIRSSKKTAWTDSERIPLRSTSVAISKKGWHTLRVTKKNRAKSLVYVRLKKKTYQIEENTPLPAEEGFYYILSKTDDAKVIETTEASLKNSAKIGLKGKGTAASRIWQLVPSGGTKFFLKNINSGLYMSAPGTGTGKQFVQKKYKKGDKTILFEALPAGRSFYLRCVANLQYACISGTKVCGENRRTGKKENVATEKFSLEKTEQPPSHISVGDYTYPETLPYGTPFSLSGKITSRYSIAWLRAQVIPEPEADGNSGTAASGTDGNSGTAASGTDSNSGTAASGTDGNSGAAASGTDGNSGAFSPVQSVDAKPGTLSYELGIIDADIKFGELEEGNYRYQVIVRDSLGTKQTVIDRPFTVSGKKQTDGTDHTEIDEAGLLVYDSSLIGKIGHQSDGTALEKKACASYALAYCNSILHGTTPSPHDYWISESTVDCVWSRGGYKTTSFSSEADILKEAYKQLKAGIPCILHVTGNTEQHWITLIGIQPSASSSSLSTSDFVAIDPWDGQVFVVSDRYKVKTSYRLATPVN